MSFAAFSEYSSTLMFGWHLCPKTGIPLCETAWCHPDKWAENQYMHQGVSFLSGIVEIPVQAELLYLSTCSLAATKVPAKYFGTVCKEAWWIFVAFMRFPHHGSTYIISANHGPMNINRRGEYILQIVLS